jgi:membrane protease YdiL (CAAX protease family)
VVEGLLIAAAGIVPFTVAASLNQRIRPDLPWAALMTLAWLLFLIGWLNGVGWPRGTANERRRRLRLWPPVLNKSKEVTGSLPVPAILLALALLYLLWIALGRASTLPDLAAYPTTSYRWSMFLMGGIVSGVVEEAAYRGYTQTGLERVVPGQAILITSVVFTLSHITDGIGALLLLGPGLFAASMLYGALARRLGTILPGMAIHAAGDLAYTFFGVLGGDASLLFVP